MQKELKQYKNRYSQYKDDIFYCKKSVGKDGRIIEVYKVRTMVREADQVVPQYILEGKDKIIDDPRILHTRKWLRRTGLDELPQLLNILKGDMSFFGPRPPSLERFEKYTDRQKKMRKRVKPGIFGNYAFRGKGQKERNLLQLEDIYLYLRLRREREGKSLIAFNGWIFVNAILALLRGENK